jgi:hypothetical protein
MNDTPVGAADFTFGTMGYGPSGHCARDLVQECDRCGDICCRVWFYNALCERRLLTVRRIAPSSHHRSRTSVIGTVACVERARRRLYI